MGRRNCANYGMTQKSTTSNGSHIGMMLGRARDMHRAPQEITMTMSEKYQQVKDEVISLRDVARVQAHLFSMDARKRWDDIDDALRSAERTASQDGTPMTDAVISTLEHASSQAREFLHRHMNRVPELDIPIKVLMTETPATCHPGDSGQAAAQIMWDHNCGAVPVVGQDNIALGIVTDRDLAMTAYLRRQPLFEIPLDSVMSKVLCTLRPTSTVGEALLCMSSSRVRRVLITDNDGHLLGIVALADLARYVQSLQGSDGACRILSSTLASVCARPNGSPA
jgi:CBS domain-containing protein